MSIIDTRAERATVRVTFDELSAAWKRSPMVIEAARAATRKRLDVLNCIDEQRAIVGTLDQLGIVPAWKLAIRVKTLRADASYLARRDAKANAARLRKWERAAIAQNGVCMEMWAEMWPTGHHEINCDQPATWETSDGHRICDEHVKEYRCESTIELPEVPF